MEQLSRESRSEHLPIDMRTAAKRVGMSLKVHYRLRLDIKADEAILQAMRDCHRDGLKYKINDDPLLIQELHETYNIAEPYHLTVDIFGSVL